MRLNLSFAVFVLIIEKMCPSRVSKDRLLQKAFPDIVQSLTARNHVLTVFYSETSRELPDPAFFESTAVIPYTVLRITKDSDAFVLTTNAFVSSKSLTSLKVFKD